MFLKYTAKKLFPPEELFYLNAFYLTLLYFSVFFYHIIIRTIFPNLYSAALPLLPRAVLPNTGSPDILLPDTL